MGSLTPRQAPLSFIEGLNVKVQKRTNNRGKCIRFLELSREIRDTIYTLIFVSDSPIYAVQDRARLSEYLGLLRTNRQVYAEVVEILYGRNTFQIKGAPASFKRILEASAKWKAPEFLNLLGSQRRDGYLHPSLWAIDTTKLCLARQALKKLAFPSHNISLDRLEHLFSVLEHFPSLEYLRLVYNGIWGVKDKDVIGVCRLFRDRRPLLVNFILQKRISSGMAEDISWTINEKPYKNWSADVSNTTVRNIWKDEDGDLRRALVVRAPQDSLD